MPQDAVRDTVVPGVPGVSVSSMEARLAPVSTTPSLSSSSTRATRTSMLWAMRRPAPFRRGSAATLLLFGRSSAVAASERAW